MKELSSSTLPPENPIIQDPIVFIFYDVGSSKALAPVLDKLEKRNINYRIIAFGTTQALLDKHHRFIDVNIKLGVKAIVDRQNWAREKPLDEEDVDRVQNAVSCQLAVVGTSSTLEAQLAKKLRSKGIRVIGYFDGFASPEIQPDLFKPFFQSTDEVIVPSYSVAAGFKKLQPTTKIVVLGQPSIDVWTQFNTTVNTIALRQKLSFTAPDPIMLYAGGYGLGYEASFKLFLEAAKQIKTYKIIISLHPKVLGATEQRIMKEMGKVLPILPSDISTMEASIVSEVIVSQCSTVGVQARFIGKKIIYLDANEGYFSDIVIEKKLAFQVHDVKAFLKIVNEPANDSAAVSEKELYERTGIAPNATNNIFEYLAKNLAETETQRTWLPAYNTVTTRGSFAPNNMPLVSINPNAPLPNPNGSYHRCSIELG